MARTVDTSSTFENWRQNYNDLATDVGDKDALITADKSSIVNAINDIMGQYFFFQDFDFDGSDGASSNTVFSGADNAGNVLQYKTSKVLVYKNGLLLRSGTHYTALNGTSVTLTSSANNSDVIRISSYTGSYTATPSGAETLFRWNIAGDDVWNNNSGGMVIQSGRAIGDIVTSPTVANSIQFDGPVYHNGTITVGVDDTGHDVKFFGATAGKSLLWDESANKLIITGTLNLTDDATFNSKLYLEDNLDMPDSAKVILGTGDDLQLYHDGSNSYIADAGTGDLRILTNNLVVKSAGATETLLTAIQDGAVTLYYDNGAKLATVTGGINVTGDTDTDTLTVSGNATVGGTLGVTGVATLTARSVHSGGITVANNGQIGSVGDADSMAIASNGVVTFSQIPVLPANTIDSTHYVDGSIDTAHIADLNVTTAKIAADAITGAKIGDDVIDSEHYASRSINSDHISTNAVTTTELNVAAAGTSGQVLSSDGDGSFSWTNVSNTNTTYTQEWVDSGDNAILRLNPSTGSDDDLVMVAGTGISLTPSGDNLTITATAASPGDGTITITAGNLIDVSSGAFTTNQSGNTAPTINVDLSELTDMTQSWVEAEDEFVVLDNGSQKRKLSSEIFGAGAFLDTAAVSDGATTLVTGNDVRDWVVAQGYTTETGDITGVTAGTGLSGGGTSGTVTVSLSHLGLQSLSDPNADRVLGWDDSAGTLAWFTLNTNITSSGTNINSTDTNTDTTYDAGSGLSLSSTTFSHSDTSSQASVDNSGQTFIQDITLDGFGHITGITSASASDANTWRPVTAGGQTLGSSETLAFTAGTGISITESAGAVTITNSVTNTNTTYSTSWVDSGANAILRLTPSSGSNDDLTIVAGTGISVTPSGDNLTITNTVSNTNTMGSGFKIRDDDNDDVTITENEYLKFVVQDGGSFATNVTGAGSTGDPYVMTITAPFEAAIADTNTTYSTSWVDSGSNAILRLAAGGSGSGNDDLTIIAGTGITVTPSGDNLTIANAYSNHASAGYLTAVPADHITSARIADDAVDSEHIASGAIDNDHLASNAVTQFVVADESSDTTCFPLFVGSATGNLLPKTGSNLTFNSSNGTLGTTILSATTVTASGDITSNTSDARLKDVIGIIENPLEKLSKINGYDFTWNETAKSLEGNNFDDEAQVGVMAQEIEEVLPSVVKPSAFEGYSTVQYEKIVPLLIESIKELQKEVESLKDSKT